MSFALLLGAALVSLVLWGVQALVSQQAPGREPVTQGSAPVLLGGTLTAMLASASAAWSRLAPIGSAYRRGVLAIICAFGTFLVALLAAPLHHYLGPWSLLALAALAGVGLIPLSRRGRG
ncbi:MAG: hypothetical protein ACREMG_11975 [Gemmatimonadales bacterium]